VEGPRRYGWGENPNSSLQDLDPLTKDIPSICFDEFSEKFILPENLRK